MKRQKKSSWLRRWWKSLIVVPYSWLYRSVPYFATDPEEKAYRLEHWPESKKACLKILKGQWGQLLDWRYTGLELKRREAGRMFSCMHHPMAGTRQLSEWRRRGPHNPPPAVKSAISASRRVSNDPKLRDRAHKILAGKE